MMTFNETFFQKIFPFYVRFDNNMKIKSSGASIRKLLGELNDKLFNEIFKFNQPSMFIQDEFQSLKEHQDTLIILESVNHPIKIIFRGQFVYFPEKDEIVYLNSPCINNLTDLSTQNLLISDFAIHDTMADNLQLLQSLNKANQDLNQVADKLITQRNELIQKNETIIELARFPDQNPDPIFRMDFDGKIIYSNALASKLIAQHNLLSLPFWGNIYLKFETNNYTTYEKKFSLASSIFLATIVPFKEKNYFNVYLRDVTETINFQNDLLITSSRLQILIDTMHSAVLAEDMNRKIILVNQTFCHLFAIPNKAHLMKGQDCAMALEQAKVLFKDEQGFIDRIEELINGEKKAFGDMLYLKDGRVFERDYLPIFEKGKFKGHIWKYLDISEQIKTKLSLQRVEEKYRKIIESLKVGLMEVDLNDTVTKVYPAFCELSGYTENELLGKSAQILLNDQSDIEMVEFQNNLRKKGEAGAYEVKLKTKDGTTKWVIVSGAPIVNENNSIIGSIGLHVDITEQKQLAQDLILANQKANASVQMKQLFLANMSHEIRTPLNVIVGMTDLINEDDLLPEQKKIVKTIKRSADSLLVLVNDLLDYSKIESGQFELQQNKFNLFEIIDQLENSFSENAKSKNISLITKIHENICSSLISDSSKLNQVLINLTSNAIKFTHTGFVKISCTLINETDDYQLIRFSIEDSGIGIEKDNLEKIFQTFTQADASISRQFGGTGLGLSISKAIIAKFGSELKVKSTFGKGSSFSFDAQFKKEVYEIPDSQKTAPIQYDFTPIKILVAEDNPLNQLLITAILKKEGIDFDMAQNGYQVLELLNQKNYDLILMDIQMPKMDGISTTKHIRQIGNNQIPILALTANVTDEDKEIYRSAGMNDFIPKPFRKEELFEMFVKYTSKALIKSIHQTKLYDSINQSPQYSLKEIENIGGDDADFIQSIVDTFNRNTPNYLNQISLGLAKYEIDIVKKAAHELKPSLVIFLMHDAVKRIRSLEYETIQDSPNWQKMTHIFEELRKIVDHVIKELHSNSK
jgi:PAS domain S-box-containing protein